MSGGRLVTKEIRNRRYKYDKIEKLLRRTLTPCGEVYKDDEDPDVSRLLQQPVKPNLIVDCPGPRDIGCSHCVPYSSNRACTNLRILHLIPLALSHWPVGRLERLVDESHSVVLSEASSRGFIAPFDRCVAGRVLEYFRLRPISRGYSDPD
ncbi:hypothetical protein F2Q69_00023585 [Brassica cretica]|uniref:Uncharacterized protein n=1 Tax=Brassica cretica TaxID=69181 RepID=A0A8S9QDC3_BRACR|nr:hypothetical protein F2Q69_00023585 [Brassica cretica]